MEISTNYLLLMFAFKAVYGSILVTDPPILEFSKEPPGQVDFSNNTGTRIECQTGVPSSITWIFVDGTQAVNISGLRSSNSDGSLTFSPFNSEAFRQDVHSTTYRCVALSTTGTIVSRDVRVRAVMEVDYDSSVYDVFAIRGNTAVIKCHIPTFLQDYVKIVAYIRDDNLKIATPVESDGKYSVSSSGALYIKDVGTSDAGTSYRCQTLPRLSGHMKTSSVVGRLFVNEPQGNVPPKIADHVTKVEVREGEVAILPCVARGYPTPITQWYIRSVVGDLLLNNQNGGRREVSNGLVFAKVQLSDSGTYLCRANNSVGSDQVEILLTVSAPLHVEIKVKSQTANIGGPLSLECFVSGFPVSSVWWLKNGRTVDFRGSSQTGREVLRIESVTLEDKGMYQCFARNDRQVVQDVSEVRLGEFSPVLLKKFITKTMDPGSPVSLSCETTGNPVPEIQWKLDTMPLNTTDKMTIDRSLDSEGNVVSTLLLKSAAVDDGGVYSCLATNIRGRVQHSARLNIHGPLGVRKVSKASIIAGEGAMLFCPVYGYPIVKVTWEKDSVPLPESDLQTVHQNGSLQIEHVQKKVDSGEYVCHATDNKGQSVKAMMSVQVLVTPKITPFAFQDDLLREGMRARIQCVVSEGDSPVSIKWTKDGKQLLRGDVTEDITVQNVDEYSSVLSIKSVGPKHNGNYTCVVSNAVGTVVHSAKLFVNALPKIIPFTFQDDQNFKGMRAHITCAVSQGDLPLTFRWLKDGREIQSSLGANVGSYDRHSSSLSIESVSSKHSGNYSCVASNEAGESRFTAQLMVQVGPKIDTLSLQDKWVEEGINVGITCILAEGDPPIGFDWTKDGQPASSLSGVHVVTPNEFTSVLTISGTTLAHSGNYSCITTNPVAFSVHTTKLNVNVAPKVVPFSFQGDHMVEGVLARVSCVVYQGDLPISIQWLKDGLPIRSSSTDGGLSMHNVDDYTSILTIDHVLSKHSGNYSCVAKNSAAAVSHTAQLVVKVPPKIVPFSFQDDQLVEGMFVRVSCVVSRGDLPLSITWTKDGQRISPDLGTVVRKLDDYSSVLSIDSVTSHHSGNYSCLAKNEAASAVYSATLFVYVPPYWIKTPDRKVKVKNGHSLLLDCQADGFPKPTISWTKAEGSSKFINLVQEKDGFVLNRNGSLFITSVTEAHSGSYNCKASNGIGVGLRKIVVVEVQNAAKIISNFGNLTVVRGNSLTLRCSATGDKPLTVQWLINNKLVDTPKQSRITVNETVSDDKIISELKITKAEKADNTIFLCKAQNNLGTDESQTHVLVQGPPDAPYSVKVTDKGHRSVEVDWSPPFDGNSPIQKYIVAYQPHGSGDMLTTTILGHVTQTYISDLKPSTLYKFTVFAENVVGRSETGGVAELSLAGEVPSGTPQIVKVISVDANTLKVSWEPPEKHSWNGNILGYHVGHRIADSGEAYEFQLLEVPEGYDKGLSFTISELKEFTQYGVVVQAFNDQGKGPLSVEVFAMTSEGVPNEPPQRVQCSTVTSDSIAVTWRPLSPETVSGILRGYRILFRPVGHHKSDGERQLNVFNVTSSTTKVTLDKLSQYTNYSMQVLGYTSVGDGLASKPVHCRTAEKVPSSPDEVKVFQSSSDSMVVVWKSPRDSKGLVTHYTVRVDSTGKERDQLRYSVHGNLTSYEIRGLDRNKRYKFVVAATSKVGEGQPSSPVYGTLLNQLKVGAKCATFGETFYVSVGQPVSLPCHVVGVPTPRQSWLFGDQEVLGTDKRMVAIKGDGSLRIESAQLTDYGNYTCKVVNDAGRDQVTHVLIVLALPSQPSLLVSSSSATAVGLFWKPGSNGNSPILYFVINYKAEFGSWQSVELQPYFVSFQLTGLLCGTTYEMYLTAVNEVGTSPPSDTVTVTTNGGVPTVPILSKLVEESTTHALLHLDTWVANGCPILYFAVEYKPKASRSWLLVSSDIQPEKQQLVLEDLNPGSWYNLRMRAHTSAGSSVAEYEFSTLSVNEGTVSKDDFIEEIDLFKTLNLHVLLPTVLCVVIILICIVATYFWVKKKRQTGGSERVAAMESTPSKGRPPSSKPKKGGKKDCRSASAADISNMRPHQHHSGRPRTGSGVYPGSDDDIAPYAMVKLSDVQRREAKDRQNCSLPRNSRGNGSSGMQAWQQASKQMVPFSIQQAYNPSAPPMSDSYHGVIPPGISNQRNASYVNSRREKVRLLREEAATAAPVVKYPTIPTDDEQMETTFLFPPPPDDLRDGDYDPPPPEMNWLPTA